MAPGVAEKGLCRSQPQAAGHYLLPQATVYFPVFTLGVHPDTNGIGPRAVLLPSPSPVALTTPSVSLINDGLSESHSC